MMASASKGNEVGGGANITVDVAAYERNLSATLAVLKTWDADLARELNAEMKAAMQEVADTARARFPSASGEGRGGFKVKKSKAKIGYTALSVTKAGVILEFAGKLSPGGLKPRGASLIRNLNDRYGSPGRFLWSTWDELGAYEMQRVEDKANELMDEYTARMMARGKVA